MRGIWGLTAAAVLLGGGAPAATAQRRPIHRAGPVRPARPVRPVTAPMPRAVRLPNRTITYVRQRPARPPVRVVDTAPTVIQPRTPSPAISPIPPISNTPRPSSPLPRGTAFSGTPIPLDQLLNAAPGLGFDYTHLAAINRDLAVRAIIDPLTQHELALAGQLPQAQPVAFFGGYGGYATQPLVIQTPQPQVIVIQPPATAAPAPQAATAAPAPAAAPPAPPVPDVGQFLLVRRDKKVIDAVAFTRQGSRIVYITAGGLRHSIALDQLDLQATEERNAERGTILHLTTD
jgi:hypothetical protein